MQTFLPYPSFADSAHVLDYRRLGKQRVETLQILHALVNPAYGWQNHPAVKMWRGSERVLALYGLAMCREWLRRGYEDTCFQKIEQFLPTLNGGASPAWLGDIAFHRSHQSNLLRKDPAHYSTFFRVPHDLPYVWPV